MAQLPINTFKTVTFEVTNSTSAVYTAPTGITSIILYAHVTNVTTSATSYSMFHKRSAVSTEIANGAIVPANDAHIPMDGKLVLETGDEITITAGANSSLKLILSILETANA